jgi:hypothetical protein
VAPRHPRHRRGSVPRVPGEDPRPTPGPAAWAPRRRPGRANNPNLAAVQPDTPRWLLDQITAGLDGPAIGPGTVAVQPTREPYGLENRLQTLYRQTYEAAGGETRELIETLKDYEFARKYLKDTPLFEGAGRWFEPAAFHVENSEQADQSSRLIIQRFRESAKSVQFTLIRPLRLICENRNKRGIVVSLTLDVARKFSGAIREQLETNEAIIRDYGSFKDPSKRWTDAEFTVRRSAKHREPTCLAVGRGGQIVSGRYDFVIIDDVEDYNSTRTETRRLATYEWLQRDVMPVVVAGGSVWIIQTPQHEMDLVGQLQKHRIWKTIRVPSEVDVEPPVPGEINRTSTWPEKWPIYYRDCRVKAAERRGANDDRLAEVASDECHDCAIFNPSLGDTKGVGCLTGKRLVEVGSAFYELQYKVNVAALGGQFFHKRWFRTFKRSEIARVEDAWQYTPEGAFRSYKLAVYFGIDPAIADEGEKDPEHHSRFALVVLGYCHELRRRLILYDFADRLTWPEQLKLIGEQALVWTPEMIYIENNVYQKALVQHLDTFDWPVQGYPADSDWFRRIASLTIFFQTGQVYVMADEADPDARAGVKKRDDVRRPRKGPYSSAPYVHEFTMWPRGAHDDRCDATVAAFRGPAGQLGFEGYGQTGKAADTPPEANPHVILPHPDAGKPKEMLWHAQDLLNSLR